MRTQRVISIVRCHAEGEVGDVIVGGVLPPPGRTMFDDHDGEGRAWITGLASEMLDPADPYPIGYVLPDTWGVSGTTSQ